ncbi:P-loop containing nucleoside triphosphate hydrolase [Pseudocohnilembus persalinus]|uniref:p-loop containing nucleoside triphosphate hydrolase n=1 Tax=Pseudocohnilembus persalinus TaxID=266149 RepID=A0A0V0QBE2_PSEPJ|nr:P-loop containing nucleoside triphosphate hydrolase [Pseudocohnilembus persalinus]|eukprot:KRW99455.1 P-loop containing nucleoside triphosphate hydrolase [Pseudocohnilembus persalinus]
MLSLKNCLENKNVIVTAETGSGKSLCYIIPVMNKILNQQDKYNQIKQDINIPINNIQKGAIILAPTKELCAQIYAMIRALDKKNRIFIQRMGSIQQIAPISSNEYSQEQLRQMSFQNVVNGVNWNNTDILVSTPSQLEQILQVKDKQDPFEVNPATIVIDEVDLLLGESTLSKSTMDILKRFSFAQNKIFGKENLERQFILAGATLPKKIKKHNTKDLFNLWFSQPYFIESENFHKIPPTIEFDNIDIDDFLAEYEDLTVQDLLVKEIQKSKSKKIIVFCDNYNTVQQIVDHLEQHKITSAPFYGSLSTEARMNILNDFHIGQFQVLVATELVSRGHCFEGVEHIIQFDFPKDAVSFLHRVGRTGRLGEKGKVTNFIREKDQFFFSKISQVLQNRVSIEQAFSRKRSLKKQAEKQEY